MRQKSMDNRRYCFHLPQCQWKKKTSVENQYCIKVDAIHRRDVVKPRGILLMSHTGLITQRMPSGTYQFNINQSIKPRITVENNNTITGSTKPFSSSSEKFTI